MKRPLAALLCVFFLLSASQAQEQHRDLDKKKILTEARASYYNVKRLGLIGFKADADPNWRLVLRANNADPATFDAGA